ncbi:hypothetical protein [Lacibacter sediminis]|uniref:Uncharacterized protein n=1 Tax=Lacibacter sediminis TaxID=2760713 RepID=A0A7G5XG70_9BACT|nr:hypothetical protein [Lacibacter sediminis]QNA44473.1 hypothetical protein H4075_20815 [Lacibacter sediminis]
MRIIASIFFLTILLFNWFGYRVVMDYVQQKADTHFEQKLDNKEYDASALIEVRAPVSLPYQTDWKEFERVSGDITINGMHYKYVERKLEGGEMIYKCIPDEGKARIVNARENFFKLVNDLQNQQQQKSGKQPATSYKAFSFDYCEQLSQWSLDALDKLHQPFNHTFSATTLSAFILKAEQPPEVTA